MFGKASAISVLAILLCSFAVKAQGPAFEWAVRTGDAGTSSSGFSIAGDAAGNVFTAGRFTGTIDFDPGAGIVNLTSAGFTDAFITKLDASGNLIWAKKVGGTQDDWAYEHAVDEGGNVYATGVFQGTADFDPGAGVFNLTASGGNYDIFVLKLDPDGNFLWARKMGSTGFDIGRAIAIGPSGSVVTTGSFEGTVDFDPGPGTSFLTAASGDDVFISKLDAAGNFVWAKRIGGTSTDVGYAITTDASGNVYSTGSFRSTADFDPGPTTYNLTVVGNTDLFVSKLDISGNFVWAKRIGGVATDIGYGIKVDITGNVYTTGYFENTADFDPGVGIDNLVSAGFNDSFVSKLDASGNHLWARRTGGAIDDYSNSLSLDGAGNIYSAGSFESTVDFDPGPGTFNLTSLGSSDAFISKLDPTGSFVWARAFEGATSNQTLHGIHVDAAGSVYTTGFFSSTVDFDPGAGVSNITAVGSNDIFISKLSQAPILPSISSFAPASGPVGTSVTINGTNFSVEPGYNIVYFGATRATVTASTSTQLTVTVPTGATYQPITVTINGVTASSNKPFLVTFPDGGTINACSFTSPLGFGSDSGGDGVAMGDLDGDGKADVIVTDYSTNSIHIFRNTSTPGTIDANSFAPSINFGVGTNPYKVSIADIDGDGKLDIIASNWGSSTISIFRNTSTIGSLTAASFGARLDLATSTAPYNISCQDLDGDGKTDIAVGNAGAGKISIWQNIGTPGSITAGSFNARLDIAGPSSGFSIADMDLDGKPDLIGGYNLGSAVGVSRNISTPGTLTTGSFSAPVNFTVATWPEHVVIGDLDADNRPDIVTSSWPGDMISILKNTSTPGTIGAGSFAAKVDISGNVQPRGVWITDYDGDGLPDIGLSNQTSNVSIYKNANTPGTITTASFLPKVNFPGTGNARDLMSGDIDGDGKPDLVVANWGSPSLMVLRNTVSSLPPPTITNISPANGPVGTTVIITGTNFSAASLLNNTVKFNGITATVLTASSTSITTVVPVGATTGTVSVTIGCSTATSPSTFNVYCVPTTERDALIALYNATDGANWDDNTGWLSADVSTWFGVTVSGCNVIDIALPGNNLVGTLPPEIGNLTFLEGLDLGANQLSGGIPPEIGNLSALTSLNLSINQLDGSVPFEMSYLSNLQVLGLAFNTLSGNLPSDLMFLNNLTDVFLNNNLFTGDLPLIGGSTANLNTLLAQFNQFTDLPDLNAYASLGLVNVSQNRLTFDDLEPYMGLPSIFYDPQAQVPPGGVISFVPGNTLSIPFSTGGTANSYQWYKDNVLIPGATSASYTLAGAPATAVGTYEVRITNSIVPLLTLTSVSYLVITDPCAGATPTNGDLDVGFAPLISAPSNFLGAGLQSTGKIITSTGYTIENSIIKSGVLRFNADGSLDNTFAVNPYAGEFLVQPDDRIIVAYSDGTYAYPVMLNSDGTDDATFYTNAPQYYSGSVNALAYQPADDKILVAATAYLTPPFVERLNPDGTSDGVLPDADGLDVSVMTVQSDGFILLGGHFPGGILRLDPTGALDPTFTGTASDFVNDIVVQADGKILIAGAFYLVNDIRHYGIVRLDPDGSVDNTFAPLGITDLIESGNYATKIILQSDGKIIVAGLFDTINGASRKNLVRLNADGTVDCDFDPGLSTDMAITGVALQTDGKLVITGDFTDYNGTQRYGLARINSPTGSTITITLQPTDATVCEGSTATFTTAAAGTTSITYQWQRLNDQAASLQGLRWSIPAISSGGADVDNVVDPPDVSATMGGTPGTTYAVTLRFRGVAEAKTYVGGTTTGFWNVGGTPLAEGYNVYQLDISDPPGTYYLNAGTSGITYTYLLDYMQTVNIKAGATVVLKAVASDNLQIKNRDNLGNPIVVPGIPPSPAPFNGQFIQMDVVAIDGGLFSDISDGGGYSGTGTSTLDVNTTGTFGAGRYRCRINGDAAPEVITNDVGLSINALPAAPTTTGAASCGGGTVTLSASGTTNGNYRWYTLSSGGSPLTGEVNGVYVTPVLTTTTLYYVSIHNGTCESATRTSVTATINSLPSAPATSGATGCAPTSLSLTATGGVNGQYRWYTVALGGSPIVGEVNDNYLTPLLTNTATYHVAINDGTCESLRTPVTATLNTVAKPIVVTSNCTTTSATLTGPTGFPTYTWSNGATTQQIVVNTAGAYTLVVTDAGGCSSVASDPATFTNAFCNQPPAITASTITTTVASTVTVNLVSLTSDLDNNLDLSTLQILVQPASGAIASINANFELIVDYADVPFAGTDLVTIQVCDVSGACAQEVITIEVAGDITVYNALSPNGDGKNDEFFIQYINALPGTKSNKLTIFNRWGSVVFEAIDYDNTNNVFRGIGNNGSELPSGTYYYTLEFTTGGAKRTGFISLRR